MLYIKTGINEIRVNLENVCQYGKSYEAYRDENGEITETIYRITFHANGKECIAKYASKEERDTEIKNIDALVIRETMEALV